MKRIIIASSLLLALVSPVKSEPGEKGDKWVAGFVEYYDIDDDKPEPLGFYDDGTGFGAEFGERFTQEWALRLEFSYLNIDAFPGLATKDEDGYRIGIDALYFLPDDMAYIFGGLKSEVLQDTYKLANFGIGRHWVINQDWRLLTEATFYQDLDQSQRDYGLKVGLVYVFGNASPTVVNDNDNDGVVNSLDQCPNTAPGNLVDNRGCDKDLDRDGVVNDKDDCPGTAITEKVDKNGCSLFTEQQVSVNLEVLFAMNSAVINNPEDRQFLQFAEFMQRYSTTGCIIEGHASAPGNSADNMLLSQQRADAVRALLINRYNIDAQRITSQGLGESQLLDTRNTAKAHKVNRRITAKVFASKRSTITKE
jgi:OOP family OmpA-OmpF porin